MSQTSEHHSFWSYLIRAKGPAAWRGRIAWALLALSWLLFPESFEKSRSPEVLKAVVILWPIGRVAYDFAVYRGWWRPKGTEPWKEF